MVEQELTSKTNPSIPDQRAARPAVNSRHLRRAICTPLVALGFIVAWADTPAQAQERPPDLTEMSLEELMSIDGLSINVLGTHTHLAGEWMIGYRYMPMIMAGNRDGTSRKSDAEVLQDFPVTPTDMTMEMHMLEVMYAPSDDLTLMAMLPYIRLSMDHVTRTGVFFTTKSDGIGDVKVAALYTLYGNVRRDWHRLIFNAGVSFPTGSIDERDDTPAGANRELPYPMQLGSGTFDLLPGITYLGQTDNWAWMGQTKGTVRLGKNSKNYTLGNRLHLTAWAARRWTDWFGPSVRMDGQIWGDIDGADPDLNPAMVACPRFY